MTTLTENQEKSKMVRLVTIATSVLLMFGSLIYLTIVTGENSKLSNDLSKNTLLTEKLLSEKLALEKDILKLKESISASDGRNTNLQTRLHSAVAKLKTTENKLTSLKRDEASKSQLKNQNKKIVSENSALEQQLLYDKDIINALRNENQAIVKKSELLDIQNKALLEELERTKLSVVNDVLMEPSKRNSKLSFNGKRIRTLSATVTLSSKLNNINFNITDPSNTVLTADETNSGIKVMSNSKDQQQVLLTYKPQRKLKSGTYVINVKNNDQSIVSLQVKLN